MRYTFQFEQLCAGLRECWVLKSNRRISREVPWPSNLPAYFAVVVETVMVLEPHRRQGICKRFIQRIVNHPTAELVIVECVQNPLLAEALLRWGWEVDEGVMDFYWDKPKEQPCAQSS